MFLNSPIAYVRIFNSVRMLRYSFLLLHGVPFGGCWEEENFQQLFGFVLIFLFLGILWVFFLIHGLLFLSEEWGTASSVAGGDGDRQSGKGVSCFPHGCADLDFAPSCTESPQSCSSHASRGKQRFSEASGLPRLPALSLRRSLRPDLQGQLGCACGGWAVHAGLSRVGRGFVCAAARSLSASAAHFPGVSSSPHPLVCSSARSSFGNWRLFLDSEVTWSLWCSLPLRMLSGLGLVLFVLLLILGSLGEGCIKRLGSFQLPLSSWKLPQGKLYPPHF